MPGVCSGAVKGRLPLLVPQKRDGVGPSTGRNPTLRTVFLLMTPAQKL